MQMELKQNPERLISCAERILTQKIITLTDAHAERSPGNPAEFYSEGDYWWPDPTCPGAPYIRRDGFSNPNCFNRHRKLLIRQSVQTAILSEAFQITGDSRFARKTEKILTAWFLDPESAMRPHLNYAQAIPGQCSGRSIGIIDTIHLAESALAVRRMDRLHALDPGTVSGVKRWFARYLEWLTASSFGQAEKKHPNNHATCYCLQCAAFALLTENTAVLHELRRDFREQLLSFIDRRGAFPAELARTKPYSYSLFQLNALCGTAALLSTPGENLFCENGPNGRSLADAMTFLFPFIRNKSEWPYPHDIAYWDSWPNRPAALFLCGSFLNNSIWLRQWDVMRADLRRFEVIRNTPIRLPRLWIQHLPMEEQK